MNYHEDDRAQRAMNIFPDVNGQINVTYVNSTDHIVAWHRHKKQADYFFCVKGSFKVGLAVEDGLGGHIVTWEYISDKNRKVLEIRPNVWHGYKALQPESIMLYHLTEKYNPEDEWKVEPGYFGEEWETESR